MPRKRKETWVTLEPVTNGFVIKFRWQEFGEIDWEMCEDVYVELTLQDALVKIAEWFDTEVKK